MKLPKRMFTLTDGCILVILGWIVGCTAITNPRAALISGLAIIFLLFRKEIWLALVKKQTFIVAGAKILVHIMFGGAVTATVIVVLWFFIALYWVFSPEGTPPGAILETTRYYWRIVFFTPLLFLGFTSTIKKSFWQYL